MSKAFDPFTASLAEAQAQPDAEGHNGAVWRWMGAQRLARNQAFYEARPLDGVALCAQHGVAAPEWLAVAFLRRFDMVASCRVKSWDDAFGAPFPKGFNLLAGRRRLLNRMAVVRAVRAAVHCDPEQAIDAGFWERIGQHAGEGKTQAQELFREAVDWGMAMPIAEMRRGLGVGHPAKLRKLAGLRRRR